MLFWDYIVVGRGLSGTVVSNRLLEQDSSLNILLIEAGVNADHQTDIVWANTTNGPGGQYDWAYDSVPQVNLDDRVILSSAGKGLGGSTLMNGGESINNCCNGTLQTRTLADRNHSRFLGPR